MGKVTIAGAGGGADLDLVTAQADDVLAGKIIVGPDGEPLTGTLELIGTAADSQVLSGKTYYNTDAKSKRTGSMLTMSGQTITPGTSQQTVSCAGKYMTDNVVIPGSADLVAGNILAGKTIFGVNGNARKYGTWSGKLWASGSRYFTGSNSGNYPYISFAPGFTPTSIVANLDAFGDVIFYKAIWGNLVHVDARSGAGAPEFWSYPFTASSVIIPTQRSNTYFHIVCMGYY